MNRLGPSMIGASSGAVFAVVLTGANGDGSQPLSAAREVAAVIALALAVPFLVHVGGVLREGRDSDPWLARTVVATGLVGIGLKLASAAPELANRRAHLTSGALHEAMLQLGGAFTVLSLYPLAICCVAIAASSWRTTVLPRWIAAAAGVTGAALAVNAALLDTDVMFGLLLFTAWCLVASVHLVRRAGHATREPEVSPAPATS